MVNIGGLKAHHFGCLTDDIEYTIANYRKLGFLNVSEIYTLHTQNVKVCFIEIGANIFLELVEFPKDNLSLSTIFKSKNPYYHIGYLVADIKATIDHLRTEGFHMLNLFHSEAFSGKLCAFLYSPEMHLIELIEE